MWFILEVEVTPHIKVCFLQRNVKYLQSLNGNLVLSASINKAYRGKKKRVTYSEKNKRKTVSRTLLRM